MSRCRKSAYILDTTDNLLLGLVRIRELVIKVRLDTFDLVPQCILSLLAAGPLRILGGLFALLLQLVEVNAILALRFGRAGLFSSLLGIVRYGSSGIGEDVAADHDKVGNESAELRVGDEERGDGTEGRDGASGVVTELALRGDRGRGAVDVDIDVGGRGVVLLISF